MHFGEVSLKGELDVKGGGIPVAPMTKAAMVGTLVCSSEIENLHCPSTKCCCRLARLPAAVFLPYSRSERFRYGEIRFGCKNETIGLGIIVRWAYDFLNLQNVYVVKNDNGTVHVFFSSLSLRFKISRVQSHFLRLIEMQKSNS